MNFAVFYEVSFTQKNYIFLCLQVLSADNLCKQFEHRSGPTICQAWSGSKLFDTLMAFQKEFFKKDKNTCKLLSMQIVKIFVIFENNFLKISHTYFADIPFTDILAF